MQKNKTQRSISDMVKSKTICWEEILKKIDTQPWASSLVDAIKKDFEDHLSVWPKDPPMYRSEWGHYYFCPDCGVRLNFDMTSPHAHVCPECHKTYTGWPYDGSWCKIMHSAIVSNIERAAILAHIPNSDEKYKKYIYDNILFYANNYDKYDVYGKHAGKGKVFPQVLSEAIFVIAIERILRMSADLNIFSESEYDTIAKLFFKPALDLIRPQIRLIHNIHAWMQSAVAACANFLGDKDLLNEAIYGEYGWINQLEKGTTEEGIWYEISPTYHYYTLEALLSLTWVALENDINLFEHPTLKKMVLNYIKLAYPNGIFPSFNDGWFGQNIFSKCDIYEQLAIFEPSIEPLLSWMYENMKPLPYRHLNSLFGYGTSATGYSRASLAALVYGSANLPKAEPPARKSFLFKDTGIAVLQNDDVRVTLKFTGDGGGHDHNDKNSVEVYAYDKLISYDVGTTGYGIPFTREWSRTPIAHNMVCINGQPQKRSKAKVLSYDEKNVCAQANDAYEGVCLERSISLNENGFNDVYRVKCDKESQIDWIFHCKGEIKTDLPLMNREPFKEENGYDQLFDLKYTNLDNEFTVSFLYEGCRLDMHFEGAKDTEVIIGKCFGIDKTDILSFIMLRRQGKETVFSQQTSIYPESETV